MSYHRLSVKPLNVTLNTLMKRVAHVGLGVGAFTPILALANPTGGTVVAGQATIATPNANGLVINQASQAAIINWQQFSIGKGQYVQFLQPSSSSVVLNRVVGGNASSILGNLNANGQVFLVNPNGIFFGKSASLDVQGIVASTLDISNSNFLTGHYVFQKGTGANANVVNQGSISTHNGGYVVLAGDYAENDGIIQARSGHVVLASGTKSTLTLSGNSLVNFAVNSATLAELAGVSNTGSLIADGGTVVMTADVANALKATVVNNTGLIEAHAISKNNGTITLTATGGNIVNAGTLDADAGRAAQAGGAIVLKTDGLTDLTNTSKITATGNGADGGSLEVSGRSINVRGAATLGKGGKMLLDPGTMSIVGGTTSVNSPGEIGNTTSVGHIGVTFIDKTLKAGTNVTISAAKAITHAGSVNLISAAGAGTLALEAHTGHIHLSGVDINIGGALTASFANASFGFIQAKSVVLDGSPNGVVHLHNANVTSGVVTKNSVKATGGSIDINALRIDTQGSSGGHIGIALQAKTGLTLGADVGLASGLSGAYNGDVTLLAASVTDTKFIKAFGNVSVTATAGALTLGDVNTVSGNVVLAATGGGVTAGQIAAGVSNGKTLTVTDITGNVKLGDISAGGALAVTDTTGNMTVGVVSGRGAVNLNDGAHTLSFSHSAGVNPTVFAKGALSLKAATIQTAGNELDLKASSAGVITVKGTMNLTSKDLVINDAAGGTINLDHAVKARSVTLEGGGQLAFIGTGANLSISASDGNLTLDANIGKNSAAGGVKYNVNLKDAGYGIFVERSIFTGNTAAGLAANVTATEVGHKGSSHGVSGVLVGNPRGQSVAVSAAGSVTLKGFDVGVGHVIGSSHGTFGAITVKAGKNVTFSASGTGSRGGAVGLTPESTDLGAGLKNTSILVQAGGNIKFAGKKVNLQAGIAHARMSGSHVNGSASASANVSLKAGGNVTLIGGASTNGGVFIAGGNAEATGSALGNFHHKAAANANVSITSTKGNITISGHRVEVSGGYGALAEAYASGAAGAMTATANANATLTAAGTISLLTTGTSVNSFVRLAGGRSVGHDGYGEARGNNEQATATAHADVSLTAAGIVLTGSQVDVFGGHGAGRQSASASNHVNVVKAFNGSNAVASYTATANVNLTAGATGISITGSGESGSVHIHGGSGTILNHASASADGAKSRAGAIASARVNIVDAGAFRALTNGQVNIQGGSEVAAHALAQGNEGGSAGLAGDGGVSLSATTITIGSAGGGLARVNIEGGGFVVSHGKAVTAGSYGGATLFGLSSVSMTATGGLKIAAGGNVAIGGFNNGSFTQLTNSDGNLASASASHHGKAVVDAGAKVSLTGATVKIASALSDVEVSAGYGAAHGAQAHASYGSAAVTVADGISITATAGNMTLSGKGFVSVRGGGNAAAGFSTFHSFGTGTTGFGSHGSTEHTQHQVNGTSYTSATAKGTGASALVNGAAGVSLTAKKGTLTIAQTSTGAGSVNLGAGGNAAYAAHAAASNGATATVSGTGALSITAGNLTVTGHKVDVFAGGDAARGAASSRDIHTVVGSHSSGEGLHPFTTSHGTTHIAPKTNTAKGVGAIAKVSGDGSVTIKGGTVSLTANGDALNISAGYGGGSRARLKASDGGLASVSAKTGVGITATVAFNAIDNGNFLGLKGAGDSAEEAVVNAQGSGAQALMNVNAAVTVSAPTVTLTGANEVEIHGAGDAGYHASISAGEGGAAKVVTDGSVSIKGATVSLAATAGSLDISAGYGGGSGAKLKAGDVALASFSAKAGVGITATTAFTATAGGNNLRLTAAGGIGRGASLNAQSSGAQALMNVDNRITLTAPTVSLNGANTIFIQGGSEDGSNAVVKAGAGGSAALTTNASVNITAAKAFTATLTGATAHGDIELQGGGSGGHGASIDANGIGAKATLAGNDDVNITATGGTITLQTGKHVGANLDISAGRVAAENMTAAATQGTATATLSGNLNLTAAGAITLNAGKGSIQLNGGGGGNSVAKGASASAAAGGKATITASDNINLTGGAVTLKAGTFASSGTHHNIVGGSIGIHVGQERVASHAHAGASAGGSANLTVNTQVNLKATGGALTMAAGGDLGIGSRNSSGSRRTGFSASAGAGGGNAKAALNINDGIAFQATGAVTITAGDNISIITASGPNAAGASAGFKGQAAFNVNSAINIVAGGAFTAKAGDDLSILVGPGGIDDHAGASHAGAQASFQSNGAVNITGATAAFSAGSELQMAASPIVGELGNASAVNAGTAAFTGNRSLSVTAKNSIALNLTGKTSGGSILLGLGGSGPFGVAAGAQARASHGGGKASVTDTGNLNLTVTGATGTITITAGSHTGADVTIRPTNVAIPFFLGSTPTLLDATAGKGGSAAITASGNINLSAKGAVTIDAGANGDLRIEAGANLADAAQTRASSGGKANLNASAATTISGGTVTLTAGDNVTITGASRVAGGFSGTASRHVDVTALGGGIAALTATDGTTIVSKGALTITAGNDLDIIGGGTNSGARTAQSASVDAVGGNGQATLTVTNGVRLTAATVALTATKGELQIEAGSQAARSAAVSAGSRKDKATFNVDDSIAITATGAITAKAGSNLFIQGGSFAGTGASLHAGNLANASMTITADVTIKAGGAFTAKAANGDLGISAGYGAGDGAGAKASDQGVAGYSVNNGVNITAATISLTAATVATATVPGQGSIFIAGGHGAGANGQVFASGSGQANYSAVSNVNLSATGGITLAAKGGNLLIKAGGESYSQSNLLSGGSRALQASATNAGVAKAATNSTVSITAGGALTLSAKRNLDVSGGYGEFALVNADQGSASAALDGGVSLKAGGALTATAGGSIAVHGGNQAGIGADLFLSVPNSASFNPGPGVVNGTITSGVSLSGGGAVTLTAGTNVTVAAGNGETLAVGAIRSFPPSPSTSGVTFLGANQHAWGGGSANLSANLGVAVTAGKALTVTAGTTGVGSLQVLGLGKNPGASNGFQNVVSVRGGSSHAVANLTLNGNATLTAGSDIILNAAGNASIAGGALFNIRADHTVGDITLTGSANATVHAGLDVMLNNIKGNLTLAGANAGPSGQEMLVDARGSAGTVNVTGHADALISAGRDVVTVTKMGGGLNLIAGGLVAAVALGGSSGAATNETAIATANAGIKAGRNVTITATGGLNLLGGDFDEASISSIGRNQADLTDNVTLTARADITAGTKVTLTVGGDAFIAGGNSLHANVEYSGDNFVAGNATADVGTGIQAGAVTLTVGGNLKARGGSGANALVEAITSDASAHAKANAGVTIAATGKTGALAITANGATASFLGGSGVTGKAEVLFGSNSATAVAHSDLTLSAGGAMSLKIKGTLLVAGGADADQFGTDIGGAPAGRLAPASIGPLGADNSKVNVTATGAVNFTAGTTLTVAQAGGDLSILAGSRGASFASVNAVGSNARTSLNVDTGVHIKAGGALAFTGAHNVSIVAGRFAASSATPFLFSSGAGAHATATVDNSVKLTGTSVHIAHTGTFTTDSSGSFTNGGLSVRGGFSSAAIVAPHVLGAHTLSVRPLSEMIHVAPMATQSSFGGAKPVAAMPTATIATPAVDITSSLTDGMRVAGGAGLSLSTLSGTGLVTELVTMAGSPDESVQLRAAFVPQVDAAPYQDAQSGQCLSVRLTGPGSCASRR